MLLTALQPPGPRTGVGNYVRELVRAWDAIEGQKPELVVAARDPGEFSFVRPGRGVAVISAQPRFPGIAGRLWTLHRQVPAWAESRGADVVLSPNFLAPLRGRVRSAIVVQDLAFTKFPSAIPWQSRLYYGAAVRRSVRRASALLVSTRCMAGELAGFEPGIASRIRIAPLGVSPTHLANDPDPDASPRGDFLCVGTLEPRKNLARVIAAHGRLCRRVPGFPRLRIAGAPGWGSDLIKVALRAHPEPGKVAMLGYLPDPDLAREYRHALGLVFCSVYEGFGLPVVEAMAQGCPVICSRGTALEEVAGGAAELADPFETADIERAMHRVASDPFLRRDMSARGRARSAQFRWAATARDTILALQGLAA